MCRRSAPRSRAKFSFALRTRPVGVLRPVGGWDLPIIAHLTLSRKPHTVTEPRTGEDYFRLPSVLFAPRVPRLSTILLRNYSCRTARATPYCCAAPLLSHRHADTATRPHADADRAADASTPHCCRCQGPLPHCCCGHTAAATLRLLYCIVDRARQRS